VIRRKFHTENQKYWDDLCTSLLSGAFYPVRVNRYTCLLVWKETAMIVRKILGGTVNILLPGMCAPLCYITAFCCPRCVHPCVTSLHFFARDVCNPVLHHCILLPEMCASLCYITAFCCPGCVHPCVTSLHFVARDVCIPVLHHCILLPEMCASLCYITAFCCPRSVHPCVTSLHFVARDVCIPVLHHCILLPEMCASLCYITAFSEHQCKDEKIIIQCHFLAVH
jgi:hypothetical protein